MTNKTDQELADNLALVRVLQKALNGLLVCSVELMCQTVKQSANDGLLNNDAHMADQYAPLLKSLQKETLHAYKRIVEDR